MRPWNLCMVNLKRWTSQYLRLPPRIVPSSGGKSSSAGDILEFMIHAVRLMTHVTEYSFEIRVVRPLPQADTLRFLSAARAAFGVSLRKLVLHAQLSNFTTLLTTVESENFEELELHLDYDHGKRAHSTYRCENALRRL
ncbi:hypothetical protein MSAN_01172100 [Mycena sanguinolenta]|uniref:Uncharacterized protein n=1 Tax=Mycena sanguinolenta TaxID=230812 RepID=A0A8H7D776_9AGAR|nr:hypothetical protein MSAN_01172100 [Mycena sanguinolenta]